jgi:uncharacterized protein (UPF0216 family)
MKGSGEVVIDIDERTVFFDRQRFELCANTLSREELVQMRLNLALEFRSNKRREILRYEWQKRHG